MNKLEKILRKRILDLQNSVDNEPLSEGTKQIVRIKIQELQSLVEASKK